jgi:A/G-specific adenine glycosylase
MSENILPTPSVKEAFVQGLLDWSAKNLRDFPWRKWPDITPYEVLVAELLLKRTTAEAARRAYPGFLERFPDVGSIYAATHEELVDSFRGVGLYNQRARATARLAEHLIVVHGGDIPSDLEDLMAVPGLGAYSARAILSLGYGVPSAVVDSNVGRVFARVFKRSISDSPSLKVIQRLADYLLPTEEHRLFNLGLLDFGSLMCRPKHPRCDVCPVANICDGAFPENEVVSLVYRPFAVWLRKERVRCGLSLVRTSQMSGVSKSTLVAIEKGRVVPRPATVSRLRDVLQSVTRPFPN